MIKNLRANVGDVGSIAGSGRFPGNLPRRASGGELGGADVKRLMKGNKEISE